MGVQMKRFEYILKKGDFKSDVSDVAKMALESSISLRKKHTLHTPMKTFDLDFSEVNKISIAKRDNLEVYQDLPKGIRVVAR